MKSKYTIIILLLACIMLTSSCRRREEPPLGDVEAGEMMTGVVITHEGKRLQLSGVRLAGVRVIPGTQKPDGGNYVVRVRFLTPDMTTGELKELQGEITFVRHEYGRSRVGFRQITGE